MLRIVYALLVVSALFACLVAPSAAQAFPSPAILAASLSPSQCFGGICRRPSPAPIPASALATTVVVTQQPVWVAAQPLSGWPMGATLIQSSYPAVVRVQPTLYHLPVYYYQPTQNGPLLQYWPPPCPGGICPQR